MKTLHNKYEKWYHSIILAAKSRSPTGYLEEHHVIPTALGGLDSSENLVLLTAREHFICHQLLPKFLADELDRQLMSFPAFMMSCRKTSSSHNYAKLREQATKFLKTRIISAETKKKMSAARRGVKMHPNARVALDEVRRKNPHYSNTLKQREAAKNTCVNILSKINRNREISLETRQKLSKKLKGRTVPWLHKAVAKRKENRQLGIECTIWDVYTPMQEHIICKDLRTFALENNLPYNTLRQTNNRGIGKRGPCKGWLAKTQGVQICRTSFQQSETPGSSYL